MFYIIEKCDKMVPLTSQGIKMGMPVQRKGFVPSIYNCVQKTPLLNKVIKDEVQLRKVLNVALEVLKGLGVALAGAAFGVFVGLGYESLAPLAACAALGAIVGGTAYLTGKLVTTLIKKFAYPADSYLRIKALPHEDWLTDENRYVFNKSVKEFKSQAWFTNWLKENKLGDNKDLSRAKRFLWKKIQKDTSYGETHAILDKASLKNEISSQSLLRQVDERIVFKQQILESIRQELSEKYAKNPTPSLKIDLDTVTDAAKKTNNSRPSTEISLKDEEIANAALFQKALTEALAKFKQQNPSKNCAATIQLNSAKKSHTLFAEFADKKSRFYDSYNAKTGFYDRFPNEKEFSTNLQKHLRAYIKVPAFPSWPLFHRYQGAKIHLYSVSTP